MNSENNKVMTIKEAVSKFVKDGDMLNPCNFVYAIPFAIVHEIIRQRKKNLTLASNAFIEEGDLLIGGGCLSKIITAYSHRGGGRRYKNELDRALRAKTIEIEIIGRCFRIYIYASNECYKRNRYISYKNYNGRKQV